MRKQGGAVVPHSLKDAVVAHKAGGVKLPWVCFVGRGRNVRETPCWLQRHCKGGTTRTSLRLPMVWRHAVNQLL